MTSSSHSVSQSSSQSSPVIREKNEVAAGIQPITEVVSPSPERASREGQRPRPKAEKSFRSKALMGKTEKAEEDEGSSDK